MAKQKAKKFERGPTPDEKMKQKNSNGNVATNEDKKITNLKVNPYSQIRNSENFKFQTIPDSPGSIDSPREYKDTFSSWH